MLCRATQDGQVTVESSDKRWFTGEENGKPLQYSYIKNPMNSMERQKDRTLKNELPRLVGAQHALQKEWRDGAEEKTTPSFGCDWSWVVKSNAVKSNIA